MSSLKSSEQGLAHSKSFSQEVPLPSFLFNPLLPLKLSAVLWQEVGSRKWENPGSMSRWSSWPSTPAGHLASLCLGRGVVQANMDSDLTGFTDNRMEMLLQALETDKGQVILAEMKSWLQGRRLGAQTPWRAGSAPGREAFVQATRIPRRWLP